MTRFAYAFAGVATAAALVGGVAGLVLGSSPTTAPTAPTVGAVQSEWHPAVTTPTAVAPAPVAQPVATRIVTIVRHQTAAPSTPKAAEPVSTPDEPTDQVDQPAPAEPVQVVEPAPTPQPTPTPNFDQPDGPWQHGGMPSSMNGTPDPKSDPVTPGDPTQTPPPLDQ